MCIHDVDKLHSELHSGIFSVGLCNQWSSSRKTEISDADFQVTQFFFYLKERHNVIINSNLFFILSLYFSLVSLIIEYQTFWGNSILKLLLQKNNSCTIQPKWLEVIRKFSLFQGCRCGDSNNLQKKVQEDELQQLITERQADKKELLNRENKNRKKNN